MGKRLGENFTAGAADPMRLVEELQLAQRATVQGLRSVVQTQAAVTVSPADSAARGREAIAGSTRELRSGSAVAVFAGPVAVGSFFQLTFDAQVLDLPPVFARCDRCTLLAEDEFEARFHFIHPVVLPTGTSPVD